MENANHQIARAFFTALSNGRVTDTLLTGDFSAWTTSSGTIDGAKYVGGVAFLASVFSEKPVYTINSLTAEEDRVVAEVQARGTLVNGEVYENTYVFILRIRDGRVAALAEHLNLRPVEEKILPLMRDVMSRAAKKT